MDIVRTVLVFAALIFLAACGGGANVPDPAEVNDPPAEVPAEQPVVPDTPLAPEQPAQAEIPVAPAGAGVVNLQRGTVGTVELPVMDPGEIVPDDEELPVLWLFGIASGDEVHDFVLISTLAVDDSDVNYMALLVDDELLAVSYNSVLEWAWDTRRLTDGDHVVDFVVRDNGNNIGVCRLIVTTDNSTDWGPPQIEVEHVRSTVGDYVFDSVQDEHGHNEWNVSGSAELTVSAWDAAGIARLDLYLRNGACRNSNEDCGMTQADWASAIHVTGATGDTLSVGFDAATWLDDRYYLVVAEDSNGEKAEYCLKLDPCPATNVYIRFEFPDGKWIPGVTLYLMPPDWSATDVLEVGLAVDQHTSDNRYCPHLYDVPIGPQHFVAVYKDTTIVIPHLALPIHNWNRLPRDDHTYVLAR